MLDPLLLSIYSDLISESPVPRRVSAVWLSGSYAVVQLDDGTVGASMAYFDLDRDSRRNVEALVLGECKDGIIKLPISASFRSALDAVCVNRAQSERLLASLLVSSAQALTAPVVSCGGDERFRVIEGVERSCFERVKRALVVGYGGLFEACAARSHISEVTVLDLFYPYRQGEIEARLNTLRRLHPKRRFRATDSIDRVGDSFSYDLVAISGSTLCTGTLDDILQSVDSSAFIILQGQSASVHPGRLFSRGVSMVETTVKPFDLIELADPSVGDVDRFRATMEGGLPLVTFLPRT